MSTYTEDQDSALVDLREAGTAVDFTPITLGTKDPTTETYGAPAAADPISGYAVDAGEGGYEQLDLPSELKSVVDLVLLFAPSTRGEVPALNATCSWGGVTRTVKARKSIAPDGSAIVTYVGLA